MKKWIIIFMCMTAVYGVSAQKNTKGALGHYPQMFKNAIQYNDANAAITALHHIVAIDPNSAYKDTLAYVYFDAGRYLNAYLVGQELLVSKPTDKRIFELVAECEEYLGMTKEALAKFEKLAGETQKSYYAYKVATLQYTLQRYSECSTTLNTIFNLPDASQTTVNITYEEGKTQPIQISAAAYNILGMILLNNNQLNEAKKAFNSALSVNSSFVLAQNNLRFLNDIIQKKGGTNGAGDMIGTDPLND